MKEKDWRLTNQENFLLNKVLKKKIYNFGDHNHCEFCWKTFTKGDISFTTNDEYHWICKECYEDFKNDFKWRLLTE